MVPGSDSGFTQQCVPNVARSIILRSHLGRRCWPLICRLTFLLLQSVQRSPRLGFALVRSEFEKAQGLVFILSDTAAVQVHYAKIILPSRKALLGCLPIVGDRLSIVLHHTAAVRIHFSEIVLCGGVALICWL
jgi:hypothetical protein